MAEQTNNNVEKQTPFLKRISELEKTVLQLKKEVELLRKTLKR